MECDGLTSGVATKRVRFSTQIRTTQEGQYSKKTKWIIFYKNHRRLDPAHCPGSSSSFGGLKENMSATLVIDDIYVLLYILKTVINGKL